MHVSSALSPDLLHDNWFLQFLFTAFLVALGLLYLLKTTASKYFVVDANFDSSSSDTASPSPSSSSSSSFAGGSRFMSGVPDSIATSVAEGCAVCGKSPSKRCAGCKFVKYCSRACQSEHWTSDHKKKCDSLRAKRNTSVALVPSSASCKILKQVDKVLFPYDEFVRLYNWDRPGYRPCGLLNCGNSCFANVVLQCLAHTKPLVSYLLDKGHKRECRRNEWCFFCELESHMERAILSQHSFSPLNILSRLPSIGGNFGYGQQEDAHECMRFAIETMQAVCLDEHGGERAVHPKSQETTLVQHIFGGQLQSQVICTKCNQVSNQYENMMDLTVEIQGDATTLEECLDQFTAKESLHGENMYKCDGCNNYVKAWKRLSIHQGPNILTIALKRFQSGRFGKLNKRITFPESLDLSPYMSEEGDCADRYNLYAVVVHVDMLNASFFGHYICYTKDFEGNWYRIDDDKVARVELDEVLSQGAYMLLYSRVSARPTCLMTFKPRRKHQADVGKFVAKASDRLAKQLVDSSNSIDRTNVIGDSNGLLLERNPSSSNSHQDEGEKLVAEANDSGAEQLGDSLNSSDPIKAIGDLEGMLLERNPESSNSHLQTEPSCTYDCRYVGDTEAHPTTYCNSTSPVSVVDGVHVNGEVSTDKSIAPDSPVGMVSCSFSSAYEVTYNEPPTSPVSVSVAASIYAENTSDKTQLFRTNELQDAGKLEEFECENELHMDRCIGTSEIVRSHQNDFSAKQNEVEFDDVLQKNHSTGISDAARRNQNDFSVTAMNGNCSDHPHLSNGDINVFVEGHLDSTSLMMQEPERCTDDMLIDGDEYRESVNLFNCEANVITLCGNAAANCQNDLSEMGNVELSRSGIDSYLSYFSQSYAHKDADKKLEI